VCTIGRVDLFRFCTLQGEDHVDPTQHKHTVFDFDLTMSYGRQVAFARRDPARLQRATKGAEQSTTGRGDHIIDRCGVRVRYLTLNAVMARDRTVGAKADRLRFGWHLRKT
jgi:hypothetical protein